MKNLRELFRVRERVTKLAQLRRRKERSRNELPPDETAVILRDLQLDMMNYGVLGSNTEIPQAENNRAVTLPHLLGYSQTVQRHFDAMRGILHAPTRFAVDGA